MYKTLMVAIDLAHLDKSENALPVAADLAKHYGADVYLVGVVGTGFSHAPAKLEAFTRELDQFTAAQSEKLDLQFKSTPVFCADPKAELHGVLLDEIERLAADLLVMGSHKPGMIDYRLGGHAGHMATHAPISVLVVR